MWIEVKTRDDLLKLINIYNTSACSKELEPFSTTYLDKAYKNCRMWVYDDGKYQIITISAWNDYLQAFHLKHCSFKWDLSNKSLNGREAMKIMCLHEKSMNNGKSTIIPILPSEHWNEYTNAVMTDFEKTMEECGCSVEYDYNTIIIKIKNAD